MPNNFPGRKVPVTAMIVDTLALVGIAFVGGIFSSVGNILRAILALCCLMASAELTAGIAKRYSEGKKFYKLIPIAVEILLMLIASCCLFSTHYSDTILGATVIASVFSDAFALFGGRFAAMLGWDSKVQALEKISPNKSYAGYIAEFFGGYASMLAVYLIMSKISMYFGGPDAISNVAQIVLALLVPFGAAFGDLLGSKAKRALEVKDSQEFLMNLPILGELEKCARSRSGYLDFMDSIALNIIILSVFSRFCPSNVL